MRLAVCWACGEDAPPAPELSCGSEHCGAILIPSRAHSLGTHGVRNLMSEKFDGGRMTAGALDRAAGSAAAQITPVLVLGILTSASAAGLVAGVPWYTEGVIRTMGGSAWHHVGMAWVAFVRSAAVLMVAQVLAGFVMAWRCDPGRPAPLGEGQRWLDALGQDGVGRAVVCGGCGTPKVRTRSGATVVVHSIQAGECSWHPDHFCVVTGRIVAARTMAVFVRLMMHLVVAACTVWVLVLHGLLLWSQLPRRGGNHDDAPPSASLSLWMWLRGPVHGDSMLERAAGAALRKAGLGALVARDGVEGLCILWLVVATAAGLLVASALGPAVAAAAGRDQGGKLAERRRAGKAAQGPEVRSADVWAGLRLLFGRPTAWATAAAIVLPMPPPGRLDPWDEWQHLRNADYSLGAAVRLLGAGDLSCSRVRPERR